jgi:hypothetical protein
VLDVRPLAVAAMTGDGSALSWRDYTSRVSAPRGGAAD